VALANQEALFERPLHPDMYDEEVKKCSIVSSDSTVLRREQKQTDGVSLLLDQVLRDDCFMTRMEWLTHL
jgi:hypothetical protein